MLESPSEKYVKTNKTSFCNHGWNSKKLSKVHIFGLVKVWEVFIVCGLGWQCNIVQQYGLHEMAKLKTDSCHNANFFISGGTGGCHYDLQCSQWRQGWQYDNFWFSAYTMYLRLMCLQNKFYVYCYHNFPQCNGSINQSIILCMHPANERRCYNLTTSLIGWVQTQNNLVNLTVSA